MPTKATAADAEVILKLYDLRREPEMRKARNWWLVNFWPENAEDFMKIAMSLGSQENNWLRQVGGYWEMAASLVLHGAVKEELFMEPSFCGEMFFIYAQILVCKMKTDEATWSFSTGCFVSCDSSIWHSFYDDLLIQFSLNQR